jgi:hypothetical protein
LSSNNTNEKPAKISVALGLMYLVVTIGIARTSMTVLRHLDVRTPDLYIASKALIYVVSIFLIYRIGKGSNWARWAVLIMLAIAIPLGVLPTFDSIEHNPLHALLGFVQLTGFVVAVFLLFQRQSSDWFNSGNSPE